MKYYFRVRPLKVLGTALLLFILQWNLACTRNGFTTNTAATPTTTTPVNTPTTVPSLFDTQVDTSALLSTNYVDPATLTQIVSEPLPAENPCLPGDFEAWEFEDLSFQPISCVISDGESSEQIAQLMLLMNMHGWAIMDSCLEQLIGQAPATNASATEVENAFRHAGVKLGQCAREAAARIRQLGTERQEKYQWQQNIARQQQSRDLWWAQYIQELKF